MQNEKAILATLASGGTVVLPTESVFGVSCDAANESAVMNLLALKNRTVDKGVIVAISNLSQITDWIAPLTEAQLDTLGQFWPGPYTFILPITDKAPKWLTGKFNGLAVRISAHPVLHALSASFGPIVTTSANKAGEPPVMSIAEAKAVFGDAVSYVDAELGAEPKPTQIIDLVSGDIIR